MGTSKDGSPNWFCLIGLRIYVPRIGYDKTGDVWLTKITYFAVKKILEKQTFYNIETLDNEAMCYWSMPFVSIVGLLWLYTLSDIQAIIDKNCYVNPVISFGAPRPACVTTDWIDASNLPLVPLTLLYRNNQISPNFPYTAKEIPEGQIVPPEVMGEYYPCGKYVNPLYFNLCCYDCSDKHDKYK